MPDVTLSSRPSVSELAESIFQAYCAAFPNMRSQHDLNELKVRAEADAQRLSAVDHEVRE